jgi:hypothetical protein
MSKLMAATNKPHQSIKDLIRRLRKEAAITKESGSESSEPVKSGRRKKKA